MRKLKRYKPSDLKRLKYPQTINLCLKNHGILLNINADSYKQPFYLTYDNGRTYKYRPASLFAYLYNGEHITVYLTNIAWFEVLSRGKRFLSSSGPSKENK